MVWRDPDKGSTHQRVRTGCVDFDPVKAVWRINGRKSKLQTTGFADPVRLHQFDLGRPIIQPVERIQQLFGHVADFKEPLREFTTLDLGPGPPAFAINHLLVRENRHIHRIPVHDGVLAVDQPFFEEIEE